MIVNANHGRDIRKLAQLFTLSAASFSCNNYLPADTIPANLPVEAQQNGHAIRYSNKDERLQALYDIKQLYSNASDNLQTTLDRQRNCLNKAKSLVRDYCESLGVASDISIDELTLATDINYSTINYTNRVNHLPDSERAEHVTEIVVPFYDALSIATKKLHSQHPHLRPNTLTVLDKIEKDLFYCNYYHHKLASQAAAQALRLHFIDADKILILATTDYIFAETDFLRELLQDSQIIVTEKVTSLLARCSDSSTDNWQVTLDQLINLYCLYDNIFLTPVNSNTTEQEQNLWHAWMNKELAAPVLENLARFVYVTPVTNKYIEIEQLIGKSGMDLNILGNQFLKQLDSLNWPNLGANKDVLLTKNWRMLSHLSPNPELLDPIAKQIETFIEENQNNPYMAPQVAEAIGCLLFSQLRFELSHQQATATQPTYQTLISYIKAETNCSSIDLELPPQQRLLAQIIEHSRLSPIISQEPRLQDASVERRLNLVSHQDSAYMLNRDAFYNQVLNIIASDFINSCPIKNHTTKQRQIPDHVKTANSWSVNSAIKLPQDCSATECARISQILSNFYSIGNHILSENLKLPRQITHSDLVEHLIRSIDVIDLLEHRSNPTSEVIVKKISSILQPVNPHSTAGPFGQALQKARQIFYLKKYQIPAPMFDTANKLELDQNLENQALKYTKAAEEYFLCSLALKLFASSAENRPVDSHRVLPNNRMQTKILKIYEQFGVIETASQPKPFDANSLADNNIKTILLQTPEELFYVTLSMRREYLRQLQLDILTSHNSTP